MNDEGIPATEEEVDRAYDAAVLAWKEVSRSVEYGLDTRQAWEEYYRLILAYHLKVSHRLFSQCDE